MKSLTKLSFAPTLIAPLAGAAEPLPHAISEMECLVGNWKGTGTVVMGKQRAKLDATWTCQRTAAQYGVMCSFRATGVPGLPVYQETDLFGWEPHTNLCRRNPGYFHTSG